MMYSILLLPFVAAAIVLVIAAYRRDRRGWAALAIGIVVILVLTVVFDSIMILVDLFRFDDELLLGIRVGAAPLEDLAYALVAVLTVAALWRLLAGGSPAPSREEDAR